MCSECNWPLDYTKNHSPELPDLTKEEGVRLDCLMDLFFRQLMTFSEYLDTSSGKVPTWKYADFVIFAMGKKLEEMGYKSKHERRDKHNPSV